MKLLGSEPLQVSKSCGNYLGIIWIKYRYLITSIQQISSGEQGNEWCIDIIVPDPKFLFSKETIIG
jgi:hypothetical protein